MPTTISRCRNRSFSFEAALADEVEVEFEGSSLQYEPSIAEALAITGQFEDSGSSLIVVSTRYLFASIESTWYVAVQLKVFSDCGKCQVKECMTCMTPSSSNIQGCRRTFH